MALEAEETEGIMEIEDMVVVIIEVVSEVDLLGPRS